MPPLRRIYAGLAVLGAVLPLGFVGRWLVDNDWAVWKLPAAWTVNDAATGAFADLGIAAVALTVWIVAECVGQKRWRGLWAVAATFCIGVSCGLPLYLFLRSGRKA